MITRLRNAFALLFLAPLAAPADVTFVHWSDIHVNGRDPLAYRRRLVSDMNQLPSKRWPARAGGGRVGPVDFVIATGDITDDGRKSEWDGYLSLRRRLRFHAYEAMGNHDIRARRAVEDGIKRLHGNTYYSFNKGGVHVVVMNEYTRRTRLPDFNRAQLDWLARDLMRIRKGVTPVVLAMHSPPLYKGEQFWTLGPSIRRFTRILNGHKAVILHGHRHHAEIHRLDGKWWVLGAGKSVRRDGKNTEYNVIRVTSSGQVTCVTYNWLRHAWDLYGEAFHMDGPSPVKVTPDAYKVDVSSAVVRSGPGVDHRIVGRIDRGVKYVVHAKTASGSWRQIWWKGNSAWVRSATVTRSSGTGVVVSVPDLNVRSGPATSRTRLGQVGAPEIYIRVGHSGLWDRINWGGRTGWVHGSYTRIRTL